MHPILIVVHQETSNPGLVGKKLCSLGYQLDVRCPALGQSLPQNLDQHTGAIVFGGPMSANDDDDLAFIRTELDWIPKVLAANKPYLGICLGAQLLARVLGGKVSPHPSEQREIGYFGLQPTCQGHPYFVAPMMVYQWHSEGFTIPSGAVKLAHGGTFPNQAFRYADTAIGIQFHPEITQAMIGEWIVRAAEQLDSLGAQPSEVHFHNHEKFGAVVDSWLDQFLTNWLSEPR